MRVPKKPDWGRFYCKPHKTWMMTETTCRERHRKAREFDVKWSEYHWDGYGGRWAIIDKKCFECERRVR